MLSKTVSRKIVSNPSEIVRDEFVILSPTEMSQRDTIGKRLNKKRLELGLSATQLRQRIQDEIRADVAESTMRQIESGKTENPGIKTVEFMALGLGLDPLETLALGLDDPPETIPGYKESQFAAFYKRYKKMNKEQQKFIDESLDMLIEKWR